jgi:predicted enzyme related to lactoylglutathione lyase
MNEIQYDHGEPTWQDQVSPDDAKAAAFYTDLFGWECPAGGEEFGGYRSCTLNGRSVAGITPQMDPGPTAWTIYFNTRDADETAAKTRDLGGQVLFEPMDVGPMGRMAVLMDPTGAVFGVWQPGMHRGAQARDEDGAACWHELMTGDAAAAKAFYSALFGWGMKSGTTDSSGNEYTEFSVGEKHVGGIMTRPPDMPAEVPAHWAVYFQVSDLDGSMARVGELGGTVLMGPMDIQPGRIAAVADPTGANFYLFEPKA